ncbi:MAG: RnfABCDGE type electron transport complex subunit B [Candidatus Margulisbacteria bacterium]|jgi:Na+-translocating ferredoxin:NAD+ oxidoreductase RNF subunit RnfB|nr:RnfABCDGE type electron transport complex subunit B [Candidatus Margulisiibacteriota bacterium]
MTAGFWALVGLGAGLGALLAYAALWLAVPDNPLTGRLLEILPGYNCGACGSPGCSGYAENLAAGTAALDLCRPGGQAVRQKIAEILGQIAPAAEEKHAAVIFCRGGVRALDAYAYSGRETCAAAALVQGGHKKCRWACLGFGDCVRACAFGAITLGEEGLPVIDADKCLDCGVCLKTCPRAVIRRAPRRALRLAACSNHDAGKAARSVCSAACIACGLCVKACPYQAIALQENLAVVDPKKCTNCGVCVEKCPTKVLV